MPIVEVQRPDGGIDELDLPDETSPETIQATVKRHVASFQKPSDRVAQYMERVSKGAHTAGPSVFETEKGWNWILKILNLFF